MNVGQGMSEHHTPEESLAKLIRALDPIVRDWIARQPEVRPVIGAIGEYLSTIAGSTAQLKHTERAAAAVQPASETQSAIPVARATASPSIIAPRTSSEASVPLIIGGQQMFVRVEGTTSDIGRARAAAQEALTAPAQTAPDYSGVASPDPAMIAERSMVKAASCRVFAERQEHPGDTEVWAKTKTEMDLLLSKGKSLPRCFLWAFWREREQPAAEVVRLCGECYENLALIAPLAAMVVGREDLRRFRAEAMQYMATAQSALRSALRDTWLTSPDADQDDAHAWLRTTALRVQQLIPRHMRLDDAADPNEFASLRADILRLKSTIEHAATSASRTTQKLNKIKYDVKRIEREGDQSPAEYWSSLATALADVDPSDRRVVEALAPISRLAVPEQQAAMILPFFEAAKRDERADLHSPDAEERDYSATVQRVRDALKGSRVVITGGEAYAHQHRNLVEAFELGELEWVSLREHASSDPLLSAIRRGGTSLVLVLIKLAGHGHVEDAQNECRSLGIPCVLLKAGINPERVASDISTQASLALGLATES